MIQNKGKKRKKDEKSSDDSGVTELASHFVVISVFKSL